MTMIIQGGMRNNTSTITNTVSILIETTIASIIRVTNYWNESDNNYVR